MWYKNSKIYLHLPYLSYFYPYMRDNKDNTTIMVKINSSKIATMSFWQDMNVWNKWFFIKKLFIANVWMKSILLCLFFLCKIVYLAKLNTYSLTFINNKWFFRQKKRVIEYSYLPVSYLHKLNIYSYVL